MKKNFFIKNGLQNPVVKRIVADASFRKYYRVIVNNKKTFIFVYSPKKKENNERYIKTSNFLNKIGLSVPKIIDYDKKKGFFLIEDFGSDTYSKCINQGVNHYKLYNLAINNIVHLQKKSHLLEKKFPKYTNQMFIDEIKLFTSWYWPYIFKKKCQIQTINSFLKIWRVLLGTGLKTKKVIVHRDFHIDNLFFLKKRQGINACGLIDFQDAVVGPSSYDLLSLLQDARRNVNKDLAMQMYNKFVKKLGKKKKEIFKTEYEILAAQRHVKVIGIFTRLFLRDKKKQYLKNIPRLWKMLENNLESKNLLKLKLWMDEYFPKKYRIK